MNNNILTIDLTNYRGLNSTSLTGRPQGKMVRSELKLDDIENDYDVINIEIPIGTTSFNPSFFLGLFYNSIKKLGSVEAFSSKFLFNFDENESIIIEGLIKENIDEALLYAHNSLKDSERGFRF